MPAPISEHVAEPEPSPTQPTVQDKVAEEPQPVATEEPSPLPHDGSASDVLKETVFTQLLLSEPASWYTGALVVIFGGITGKTGHLEEHPWKVKLLVGFSLSLYVLDLIKEFWWLNLCESHVLQSSWAKGDQNDEVGSAKSVFYRENPVKSDCIAVIDMGTYEIYGKLQDWPKSVEEVWITVDLGKFLSTTGYDRSMFSLMI
jgi:hypothetical protein